MTKTFPSYLIAQSASYHKWSLRDILASVFYYKKTMLIAFCIPFVMGVFAALSAHTNYSAHAQLLILYGNEYVFHPADQQNGGSIALDRNQIMEGEQGILNSPVLIQEVIEDVGLKYVYPRIKGQQQETMERAVLRFGRDLQVSVVPQSNIIELKLRNANRDVAAKTLAVFIKHYLNYRAQVFSQSTNDVPDGKRQQLAARVKEAEAKLVSFDLEHNIGDLPQQISLLLRQISDLDDEQTGIDSEIGNLDSQVEVLKHALSTLPPIVELYAETDASKRAEDLATRLVQLKIQRADVQGRYKADFPLLQDIDRQISALKQDVSREQPREKKTVRMGVNTIYSELQQQNILLTSRAQGLHAKRQTVVDGEERLNKRLRELVSLSGDARRLQDERDILSASYKTIAQNVEETRLEAVATEQNSMNIRIVHPSEASPNGVSLRLPIFVLSIVVGILSAAALLALRISTQRIFITVKDVENTLGLPVLAAIPNKRPETSRQVGV